MQRERKTSNNLPRKLLRMSANMRTKINSKFSQTLTGEPCSSTSWMNTELKEYIFFEAWNSSLTFRWCYFINRNEIISRKTFEAEVIFFQLNRIALWGWSAISNPLPLSVKKVSPDQSSFLDVTAWGRDNI